MAGHQIIGVLPSRKRLDAVAPSFDRRIGRRKIEARLFRREEDVAGHREIGDRRLLAQEKRPARKMLVDDGKSALGPGPEEGHHSRIAILIEGEHEEIGRLMPIEFVLVEHYPAPALLFL